jgi:hypothetical protein
MQGQRQGIRFTCPIDAPVATNKVNLPNTTTPVTNRLSTAYIVVHHVLIQIINLKDTLYTDQKGRFPFVSSLGNHYIMILYHLDSNSS